MAACVVSILVVATACNPIFGDDAGAVRHASTNSTTSDHYRYTSDIDTTTVHADAPFPDGNAREFFWNTDDPYYADQQACITWHDVGTKENQSITQQGLAMRIAPSGDDGTGIKAITVNQNIYAHAYWTIWVNTWDTTRGSGGNNVGVESFNLGPVVREQVPDGDGGTVRRYVPAPWYVCARTEGLELTFKLWTHREPEPGWDDPTHVFTTTLPEGWDHAGYSGGYIGHLVEGETATFSGFTTAPLCLLPDMIDTPGCRPPSEEPAEGSTQ